MGASKIEAIALYPDDTEVSLAQGDVSEDGTFSLELPETPDRLTDLAYPEDCELDISNPNAKGIGISNVLVKVADVFVGQVAYMYVEY
ncbi:MAG: hypothetical protein R2865_01110 [Deinococcales bacterium]